MCDHTAGSMCAPQGSPNRRMKLWQLPEHLHCAVLGTCLTMAELRKVQRQSDILFKTPPQDYQLHTMMVQEAAKGSVVAKYLQKQLEKKYQRWVKQLSRIKAPEALEAYWDSAISSGDIPGSFWALMTHPRTSAALRSRAYGDVHMLSHLQGASHRAELKRSAEQGQELEELRQSLADLRVSSREKIVQLEAQLRQKDQALQELKAQLPQQEAAPAPTAETLALQRENAQLKKRLHHREQQLAKQTERQNDLERSLLQLEHRQLEHKQQAAALATQPASNDRALETAQETRADSESLPNLQGKQILYVGGRTHLTPRLRELVESNDGQFVHHDGGKENSRAGLQCLLAKADMVFCPIDCVSHDACLRVKNYCQKNAKPFVPLRSAGLSTFAGELIRHVAMT